MKEEAEQSRTHPETVNILVVPGDVHAVTNERIEYAILHFTVLAFALYLPLHFTFTYII